MRLFKRVVLGVSLLCLLSGSVLAQAKFAIKNGDRVLFYGDSITEQKLYTVYAETFIVTRFPKLNVSFVHAGIGGDRVGGGWAGPIDLRLDRDVNPFKPTVMSIMLGMNDGSYRAFDKGIYDIYCNGYKHILDRLKAENPKLRLTLIQASPYDDVTRAPGFMGGYNAVLVNYGEFVKEQARTRGMNAADLNGSLVGVLARAVAADPTMAQKIVGDRVHPGPGGHLIMAEALVKSWNAPAIVSFVEINAGGSNIAKAVNTSVSELSVAPQNIAWTQLDGALPFPINTKDEVIMLAINSSDFIEALNQQTLQVTGLTGAKYALTIDGAAVGSFTREELTAGVNLAALDTPMAKQAATVLDLTFKHNNIHREIWQKGQGNYAKMTAEEKVKFNTMDPTEVEAIKAQKEAAQPKPHKFALTEE